MSARIALLVFTLLVGAPASAVAQLQVPPPLRPPSSLEPPPLEGIVLPKFFVTGGAGVQISSSDFTHTVEFDLFREIGQIGGPVELGRPVRFLAGAGFRLHRRLGVGVAVGGVRTSGQMDVTFFMPSPFQFSASHTVTASAPTDRRTLDTHVSLLVLLNHGDVWRVTLHTGPTFSRVSQQLATDRFAYSYAFPFTEIAISPIDRSPTSGTGIGGHIALSMARRLNDAIAIDTQFLWHTATATLQMRDVEGGTIQRIQAGGLQVVFGIRYSR